MDDICAIMCGKGYNGRLGEVVDSWRIVRRGGIEGICVHAELKTRWVEYCREKGVNLIHLDSQGGRQYIRPDRVHSVGKGGMCIGGRRDLATVQMVFFRRGQAIAVWDCIARELKRKMET